MYYVSIIQYQAGLQHMKKNSYVVILLTAVFVILGHGFSGEADQGAKPAAIDNTPDKQAKKPIHYRDFILFHSVCPGDNLYGIAQTYGTTVASLSKVNNLESTIIQSGQQIYIPLLRENETGTADRSINASLLRAQDPEDSPLRFQLVETGIGMLGISYRRGGSGENGFDCSGLVKNLYARFDIELPRNSRQQYRRGRNVDRENLETGDLVFFSSGGKQPDHVGIYIGGNKFLHAAIKARKVIISDLNKNWYAVRFLGGRRIMDLWRDDPDAETDEINTL